MGGGGRSDGRAEGDARPQGEQGPLDARRQHLRDYQREWVAARRRAWFQANGPCVECGSWEQLELDHIDPALKVHHAVWSWRKDRREEELAKCQALCASCHQAKTIAAEHAKWESNTAEHLGRYRIGVTGYRQGCRCVDCCRAKSEEQARYRARRVG